MKNLVTINLTTRTIKSGQSPWTPPVITFGETLTLAMRFQVALGDSTMDQSLDVRSLRAAVGVIDLPPTGGTLRMKFGSAISSADNTTGVLQWNGLAKDLQGAINAIAPVVEAYGSATVTLIDGSIIIRFGISSVEVPITVMDNTLFPVSFGRVTAYQINGKWIHELRLIQTPVAFTDAHDRVLPPQPTITRVQAGGSDSGSGYYWNEIQNLVVPADFRGAYQARWGSLKSQIFLQTDGVDTIQAALNQFGDGFKVYSSGANAANIEFIDTFKGAPQDLMTVSVFNNPEGDLTFNLPFNTQELATLLRSSPTVTLPFDAVAMVADEADVVSELLLFRVPITIQRPLIWDELAEIPAIDWLIPPSPVDYDPFTRDQVITGTQYYVTTIGNGSASSFNIAHGLATEAIQVTVRENVDGGSILAVKTDYTVTVDTANSITVTRIGTVLAAGAWAVVIASAGPKSAFQSHTHTIAQIVGLQDELDALGARLTAMEAILPSTGPAAILASSSTGIIISLGNPKEILFAPTGLTAEQLGRAPYMLPAVHIADATTALPIPLPSPVAGTVWTAADRTLIPGGGNIRSSYVKAAGFVASDGRINYPSIRSGTTTSYYPAPFERELFQFFINDQQLAVNRVLDLRFAVDLQLLKANSDAQWMLVIEKGTAPQDSSPATTGINLQNLVWDLAAPLVSQRIILTPLLITHPFGCRISRTTDGITADAMKYGVWSGANSAAPAGANFALRARLINFDTEDSATTATGFVSWALNGAPDGPQTPQAVIS